MAQMTLPEEDEVIQHSFLIVFTNRSACGLQLGLFAGVFTLATPLVRRIATNASVNTDPGRGWVLRAAEKPMDGIGQVARNFGPSAVR